MNEVLFYGLSTLVGLGLFCFLVTIPERRQQKRKQLELMKIPPEVRREQARQGLREMGIDPDTGKRKRYVKAPTTPFVEREDYKPLGGRTRSSSGSQPSVLPLAKLSEEDLAFLDKHGIPVSATFDSTGLKKADYASRMKDLGKELAYGVSPCSAAGHQLRNRSGHCVRCRPEYLAFQKRYSETGFVYVAISKALGMTKVGFSADPAVRLATLNRLGYAGTADWIKVFDIETASAGRVEFNAQKALEAHRAPTSYDREGASVECNETFYCDAVKAIDVVKDQVDAIRESA